MENAERRQMKRASDERVPSRLNQLVRCTDVKRLATTIRTAVETKEASCLFISERLVMLDVSKIMKTVTSNNSWK